MDKIMSKSEARDWEIAQAAAHWLREHGYFVKWDDDNACYRVVEEGADQADDQMLPQKFKRVGDAFGRAFELADKQGR